MLSNGTTIAYEYDAEERITKVDDSLDGVTEYTYDALGQLLTETVNGELINTMTYDNYGNILTKNGVTYSYCDCAWKDRLTAVGDTAITYDAQGNPTNYLGHALAWEKGRQLKSFDSHTYTYNANGIRTSKTVGSVKHTYTLDGTKILQEEWSGNTLVPLYDNEDGVCGILYNGTPYYFRKNLQGDIIAITNANGNTVACYAYDAWGVPTVTMDVTAINIATVNPFRYRGYYYDLDTGLYYLQSRYYDPEVGRFVNADDVTYLGISGKSMSYNLFVYCENDSVDYVDYFGHAPSLYTFTQMHNAVVRSAQTFLFSVGTITTSEVRTSNRNGKYIGRMDIYSYITNRVWEVKRNNSAGIRAGLNQLQAYTSSYVYSLYHSWYRVLKTPRYGNKNVYGCVVVSGYLVTYRSYVGNPALILYDYMSLQKAAELLFSAVMATSIVFSVALSRIAKKTKEKVYSVLSQVRKLLNNVAAATKEVLNAITSFLKKAAPVILLVVAIIIFLCTGVPVFA